MEKTILRIEDISIKDQENIIGGQGQTPSKCTGCDCQGNDFHTATNKAETKLGK